MSPQNDRDQEQEGRDADRRSSRRILYWWPNPVSPEDSAGVGQKMLTATIVWFIAVVLVFIVIGVLLS